MRLRALGGFLATLATVACGSETTSPPISMDNVAVVVADRDNTLYEDGAGQLSNGSGEFLFAGLTSQPGLRRALVHFDLTNAGVPDGARVDSVTLTLNLSRTNAGPSSLTVHRVTADWGEGASVATGPGGMGIAPQTGDATWIHRFFDTALWTTVGGDFVTAASASVQVEALGLYTWGSTGTLVADVRGWLADATTNFGWIILGDENTLTSAKRFDSRENTTAANRPTLRVFYTAP